MVPLLYYVGSIFHWLKTLGGPTLASCF